MAGRPFDIKFLGAFCLTAPDGTRVQIRSRKAIALLGMLATAERGERTRAWLQDKLWGSRELPQAQTSLRRELTGLRTQLNGFGDALLHTDSRIVRLNFDHATIDIRDPEGGSVTSERDRAEFLEGLDFAGEEGFLEWLKEARRKVAQRHDRGMTGPDGAAKPWISPTERRLTMALAIRPLQVSGRGDGAFSALPAHVMHTLVKCLASRRWLPIIVPGALVSDGSPPPDNGDTERHEARYVLESHLLLEASSARLGLDVKVRPWNRLLTTETLHITDAGEGDERVARLCNEIVNEVFYAETRRAQSLAPEECDDAALIQLVRHLLGQLSLESLALAQTYLDAIRAHGRWDAEHVILDAYVKVFTYMGSSYEVVDHASLRTWASTAVNVDPTDYRGVLLISLVELWLGNPEQALAHARVAKELSPDNGAILAQLGVAHNWAGQPQAAMEELTAAMALSKLERRPYLIMCNLGLSHLMLGQPDRAIPCCDQASACVPDLGLAYFLKIEALVQLGRIEDAARVYRDSVRDCFDDLPAIVRHQRVLPEPWIDRAARSLEIASKAAADRNPSHSMAG